MARTIRTFRGVEPYRQPQGAPGLAVDELQMWSPPRGINNLVRISRVSPEFARSMTNFMFDDACLRSRKGISALGAEDSRVQAVLSFTPQLGSSVLLRIRTDGVDSWNGSEWDPVVDIILTGHQDDLPTWTGWGNELLICNGADKIVSYNPVSGRVKVLEESSPARHLTSFGGRVVASAVTDGSFYGARIRWCVKLNNEDWTSQTTTDAIGAGYEDLLASPGGYVDEVMGVFPLSDESAVMVRENSVWMVMMTGDVNAPFRFNRITGSVGCRARRSISITPYGIVFPTSEDIAIVDQSGTNFIGDGIRREFFPSIEDFDVLVADYDPRRREYRLANSTDVWRYNFTDKGWTHDRYPFNVRHLSFVSYRSLGLHYDDLQGTMDDLTGTMDNLNLPFADEGMHFVSASAALLTAADTRVVVKEDVAFTTDNTLESPLVIETALLAEGSPRDKTTLLEIQVEYECEENQRLVFEYSLDKGSSWRPYSFCDIEPTAGPQIVSVRRTVTHHNIQARIRTDSLGKFTLIAFTPFLVKGGRVHP